MPTSAKPQPIRGSYGADDPGPRNIELDLQNPDILIPPPTDNGSIPNLKFSFGMAHNRLEAGGWAREVTVRELPAAKGMAGVDMRLGPGVVRELHWHKEAEWGYVLEGRCRVTAVDADRGVFVDDLKAGDIWLFPSGIPHSIQAHAEGCEFLLVFDDGNFSENETLLVTELMAHMPIEVVAKNFGIPATHFANLPPKEKYIFPLPVPPPLGEVMAKLPKNRPAMPFTVHGGDFTPTQWDGGKTTVIDVRNFPVTNMAALIIDLEPGALREIHWHPDADEWQYYIQGEARMTVFDATSKARTFNYRAGDVGYVPKTLAHYIENIGTTPVRVLNVFNKPLFKDVPLNQWLALTPPDLVRGHLELDDIAMAALNPNPRSVTRWHRASPTDACVRNNRAQASLVLVRVRSRHPERVATMPSDADMAAALETANGAGARSMLHGVFALSLTCMAGYLDAVGYTHLAGLYVSFMSGNSTRLGIAIAKGDRELLVPCVVVIIGFVAGAFIGSLIANAVSRFKLTAVLATETALLLSTIALSLDTTSYAALLPICVAMGIQNAAHETIAGAELGKSFITGFLFNLGKALAHLAQGRGGAARALAYGASWSAFLLGVVLGTLALGYFGLIDALSGAAGVLLALAIGAASDQFDPPNPIADSRRRSTSP